MFNTSAESHRMDERLRKFCIERVDAVQHSAHQPRRDDSAGQATDNAADDEDMAGAAVFLASRAGDYVVGETIVVDGGVTIARG